MRCRAVLMRHYACLAGTLEAEFQAIAAANQRIVLEMHWNPVSTMFATIPTKATDDSKGTASAPHCNLTAARGVNTTVNVRELLGFMPWYFSGLIPQDGAADKKDAADDGAADDGAANTASKYLPQWKHLFDDPQGLAGPYGLRSAERRDPCYNYSWTHGDCKCGEYRVFAF